MLEHSMFWLLLSLGAQIMGAVLAVPVLAGAWHFSESSLLTMSSIFSGMGLGSLFQQFADHYGRKPILLVAVYLQVGVGLLTCLAFSYESFLLLQFMFGFCSGVACPLSVVILTEISAGAQRASKLGWSNVYFALGYVIAGLLAWGILAETGESWRVFLLACNLPAMYVAWVVYHHAVESPRFLLVKGRAD
jgi:MFS family permease